MKLKNSRPIKLANGLTVPEGETVHVIVENHRPTMAKCYTHSAGDFTVLCSNLWRYFDEFIRPTLEALEEAVYDGECPSIAGAYNVEPDGWDENGMPSILLAVGMI